MGGKRMEKQAEACVVIKSSEKSKIEDFYLLFLKQDFPWDRYYIIFDLLILYNRLKYSDLTLASYVDNLINNPDTNYYPLSKSDYEYFISNNSVVKKLPFYFVEVDKGHFDVTFSQGMSINYSLPKWVDIAYMIWELGSLVTKNVFDDDAKCPCFKCIVQVTCVEKSNDVDENKIVREALNPCSDFNKWKKDKFLEIWNTLPDDIKQLEQNIYEEMILITTNES